MKIVVIGVGAMGCLLGGCLAATKKHEVWLLGGWQLHISVLQREGLTLISPDGHLRRIALNATSDQGSLPAPFDLALICVKSHSTSRAAASAAALLAPEGLALTLQNGLGNRDILAGLVGEPRAVQGVTSHGASLLEPGLLRHAGRGPTHLAIGQSDPETVHHLATLLTEAGFSTEVHPDLQGLIWGKLLVNVGINALTALLRIHNGVLAEVPEAKTLMVRAVQEAAQVAEALGVVLPYSDPVAQVMAVATATAANRSSMLADALRGTPTEIEVINGAIVRTAERLGIQVPFNTFVTEMMRALDATSERRIVG